MLAQNFKTAKSLGIKKVEREALVKVLGMLERGELVHVQDYYDEGDGIKEVFNMGATIREKDCGTVACICGWAHILSEKKAFPQLKSFLSYGGIRDLTRVGWPANLQELFRLGGGYELRSITAEQAATALRNYLTTGKANWAKATA